MSEVADGKSVGEPWVTSMEPAGHGYSIDEPVASTEKFRCEDASLRITSVWPLGRRRFEPAVGEDIAFVFDIAVVRGSLDDRHMVSK